MLQISNISKQYKTGDLVQRALDGVSLSLRDNEFVSVLGPSGSGKTTLLNIIGGLDRYDSGDLVINGISTKRYSDRDWDSYRNHTIGFVFQSYNLIPHQTILANVELALTISGISKSNRTSKARTALEKVGLGDQIHKKPSQLSGGQMQRVAIARALVNDPDILLADEPTGALDSDTSVQVMELLKEVAKDRLVVMVTHNPELAEQYSTRIVTLKDGKITSDSDPYEPKVTEPSVHRNMGKSSMSFFTALLLSFNNLWTKKARTILVAFAGSIGIIGIALILSMSNGANNYIKNIEEESLQSYPLQITDTSFNFLSMMSVNLEKPDENGVMPTESKDVRELKTITSLLSTVDNNDLKALKAYFESDDCDIDNYVQAIEYDYNLAPQIYSVKDDGTYRKVNPDNSFSALGFSSTNSMNGLLSAMSSTDTFHMMPENELLYQTQYEVKAGHWPENYNECVVVVSALGTVYDMTLYTLGMKDPAELDKLVKAFADGVSTETDEKVNWYDYEDFLGVTFRLANASDYYRYDEEHKIWTDHSDDEKYMKKLLSSCEELKVVGVVRPLEDVSSPSLLPGIGYPPSLIGHIVENAEKSEIVKAQMKKKNIDVFTGKKFGEKSTDSEFDLGSLFTFDEKTLSEAFQFNESDFDLGSFDFSGLDLSDMDFSDVDMSSLVDSSDLSKLLPQFTDKDYQKLFAALGSGVTAESVEQLFATLTESYLDYAKSSPYTDYSKLPEAITAYLESDDSRQIIFDAFSDLVSEAGALVSEEELTEMVQRILSGLPAYLEKNEITENQELYIPEYLATDEAQALIREEVAALRAKAASLMSVEKAADVAAKLLEGYSAYARKNRLPLPEVLFSSFTNYLDTDEAQKIITDAAAEMIDSDALENLLAGYFDDISEKASAMMGNVMTSVMGMITEKLTGSLTAAAASMANQFGSGFADIFKFDPESLSNVISMNMDANDLSNLMLSLLSKEETNYDTNLKKMGYVDTEKPSTITIYPTDFDGKTAVKKIISDYNDRMEKNGEDDKVISYTDTVDVLMSSVTDIVNAISYVLIAFVAISLVVSSIMIGVITYISVLERKKEIGILRAIGASKRNISEVFNAETFIIGALAGVFGVVITYLLLIPANAILHALIEGQEIRAALPPMASVILIVLSVILTLIGGLIPSRKAAKADPVIALRTE